MIDSTTPTYDWDASPFKPGCLPRKSRPGEVCPMAADHIKLVPRADWDAAAAEIGDSIRKHVQVILNQASVGSCAAESSTGDLMIARSVQGLPFKLLNPYSLYHFSSHGSDSGSSIDENLQLLRDQGVCSEEMWPRSRGWRSRPPAAAMEDAKNYRIEEFYDITTIDEFVSALLSGFAVVFGASGHAIVAVQHMGNRPLILNSWDDDWEDGGFGYWVNSYNAVNWAYGAWAARLAKVTS
jgi:hypothetical protein